MLLMSSAHLENFCKKKAVQELCPIKHPKANNGTLAQPRTHTLSFSIIHEQLTCFNTLTSVNQVISLV